MNRVACVFTAAAFLAAFPVQAGTLLAEEASAAYPLEGETRLEVQGIVGEVLLQSGVSGRIGFQSTSMGEGNAPVPVALWQEEGGALRLSPAAANPTLARRLLIGVPSEMDVRLQLAGARIVVGGIQSGVEIAGEGLKVEAAGTQGPLHLDLRGGTVNLTDLTGDATVSLVGGTLEAARLASGLDAETHGTKVTVQGAGGAVRLHAEDGDVRITGLEEGGDLTLKRASLEVTGARGQLQVETDGACRFEGNEASLWVRGQSGPIHVTGNVGAVEIETNAGSVAVERCSGPVQVRAEGGTVGVKASTAEVGIAVYSAEVTVIEAGGNLTVSSVSGNIAVDGCKGDLKVESRGGDVHLSRLAGAVSLEANGRDVQVEWAELPTERQSVLQNDGGDLVVRLPHGSCALNAEAPYGRVESELGWVRVDDDGSKGRGVQGGPGGRHDIQVRGSRDIWLKAPGR